MTLSMVRLVHCCKYPNNVKRQNSACDVFQQEMMSRTPYMCMPRQFLGGGQ
jgi:hypothetical protein